MGWKLTKGGLLFFFSLGLVELELFGLEGRGSRVRREPMGEEVCEVEVEEEEVLVGRSGAGTAITTSSSSLSSEEEWEE